MAVLNWIGVFLALLVTDFCWGMYVKKMQESHALKAGMWAAALFIPGAFVTLSYVSNPWLLIPAGLGAFCGTALSVYWDIWQKRLSDPEFPFNLSLFTGDR